LLLISVRAQRRTLSRPARARQLSRLLSPLHLGARVAPHAFAPQRAADSSAACSLFLLLLSVRA